MCFHMHLCRLSFQSFFRRFCGECNNPLVPFKEDNFLFIFAFLLIFDYVDSKIFIAKGNINKTFYFSFLFHQYAIPGINEMFKASHKPRG